jgi:drug/metabolite transporter (DMT)-like permease
MIWTIAASSYALIVILISGLRNNLVLPKNAISKILILGLATGIGMILGWAGLALLDPSFASFLWRFAPVLTIILSAFFLREKVLAKEFLPIAIMVIGGALTTLGRWHIVGTGVILTLLACCAVSVQMLMAKMKIGEVHPNILVFYRVGIAAVIITLWTFAIGKANFNVRLSYWAAAFVGAFLGPCASFLLTFRSYKYWSLSRSSIILTAQPLIVLPMALLAFGKIPTGLELVGGLVILAGAFWLVLLHSN